MMGENRQEDLVHKCDKRTSYIDMELSKNKFKNG